MKQTTIKKHVEVVGVGLHKGVPVKMSFDPLPPDSGIVFFRTDKNVRIELKPDNVVDTTMATVIGKDGVTISTIEHLLSAIYAYGIDNLLISVDNEEIPIMDGSSIAYCTLLDEAGIEYLDAKKKAIEIKKPIEVKDGDKFVRIEPSKRTVFDFKILFDHPSIQHQNYRFEFSTQAYKEEIARARTFGFLHEVNYLRSKGLARGGGLNNCIVLDENGILNKEGLRYQEEFVRHKILDAIGDMAILGMPLLGTYVSFAGSHRLNHLLTKQILAQNEAYELVELPDEEISYEVEYAYAKEQ